MGAISGSTAALIGMMAISTAASTGTALYTGGQQAKQARGAREQAARLAAEQRKRVGELTAGEARVSASKRAFRQGLFLTSPTGAIGGRRGRSRLLAG